MLREGVRAAQEGKRAEARNLLLRVTETDADNENAWLWLASISEYPEELLVFLNHVLRVNPQNERALEWHKATNSLLAKTLVQRGIDAAGENRTDFARQCFEQAIGHESENEMAWLWMASIADSEDEKTAYFERVLSVNPANATALFSLEAIRAQKTERLFETALEDAFEGRHADAQRRLEEVFAHDAEMEDAWVLKAHLAASFEERAECFLKLRVINPENELARASLASWRTLAGKRRAAPDAPRGAEAAREEAPTEAAEFAAADAAASAAVEFFGGAEFVADDRFGTSGELALEAAEAAAVAAEEEAPAAIYFEVEPEAAVAERIETEEPMPADAPTQELSLDSIPAAADTANFDAPEQNQFVAATDEAAVDEVAAYEEFYAEEVRFEAVETADAEREVSASPADLRTALEAEEAEMNWAFSYSKENKEAEEYFKNLDEIEEDIHKTQQANYDEEDFLPNAAPAAPGETVEAFEPPQNGEWREAAPSVFIDYAPELPAENVFEMPPAAFSAESQPAEMTIAEVAVAETAPEAFEEQVAWQPSEQISMNAAASAPASTEEKPAPKPDTVLCPFCDAVNEKQAFACVACQTVLTLSDLEMLLAAQPAAHEALSQAVESLARENEAYGLNAEQMTNLGVGQINLKNYRQGFFSLQEAVRMNPSNVLLDAQVNALAIRLSEIEEQQSAHDAMAKNRKILVVDDSPTVRKLISGKLEKCGHEVVCAVDGVDALEKINELVPDLVLLDITMPRMDGYQVCKLIRNNESTKDVPVVMISGKDGFFDKVRGRMAGTSGYITKPFGPETLMKTVEAYLN
jgi:CheY-like chemotaxis protein